MLRLGSSPGARSRHQCSVKEGCSQKFLKIHRKTPVSESLFNKVAGLTPATFFKKRISRRCFPVNFAKFLRTPFLQNTSRRQLLQCHWFSHGSTGFLMTNLKTLGNCMFGRLFLKLPSVLKIFHKFCLFVSPYFTVRIYMVLTNLENLQNLLKMLEAATRGVI